MTVTLFTRPECGLCREAEETLRRLQQEIAFDLSLVNIDSDQELYNRYWDRVPVLVVNGKEVAAVPPDERRLRALLSARARRG